ncbi:MAG: hypothetical protein Q8909_07270 [Bacteroidota bacterium]|nr:hypothetical protein [Bacteroidota bacterium]
MARRLSHILIMITLILATAGVTVTRHYCGNELKKITLAGEPKSCCGDHCNCCHNETFTQKVTNDYLSSNDVHAPAAKVIALDWLEAPSVLAFSLSNPTLTLHSGHLPYNSPPLIADNPPAMLQVFLC